MKNKNYDDIIMLNHPTSKKHPRMAVSDRAAQFSPFAALTGYEAAVNETARLTDEFVELDETQKAQLDIILKEIREKLRLGHPEVKIVYFQPDEKKAGGVYLERRGKIKKIDEYERCIVMEDGDKIAIGMICEISEQK